MNHIVKLLPPLIGASDDTVAIEEGIKTKGWLINSKDETDYGENNTALHYSAHKGSVETVKFLVRTNFASSIIINML